MLFWRERGSGQRGEKTKYNQVIYVHNLPIYLGITQYRGPHNDHLFSFIFSLITFPNLLPNGQIASSLQQSTHSSI